MIASVAYAFTDSRGRASGATGQREHTWTVVGRRTCYAKAAAVKPIPVDESRGGGLARLGSPATLRATRAATQRTGNHRPSPKRMQT